MTEKADRIERLMNDPDLQQAFKDVEQSLLNRFASCGSDETELMADIHKHLLALKGVRLNLSEAIRDGKLERYNLEQQRKARNLGELWKSK